METFSRTECLGTFSEDCVEARSQGVESGIGG